MTFTPEAPKPPASEPKPGNLRVAALCASLALGMMGLAYASAPLYDLFCRVTGFGGTPMVGTGPAGEILDRTMAVRFDANVAPGLTWRFRPEAPEVKVRVGETTTVHYTVTNTGPEPATGVATFNVQPPLMGSYFVKLQCFCFTEQTLQPGETMESAVVFYVDPAMAQDPNVRDKTSVTLSYTYFPAKAQKPVTAAAAAVQPT
jgi:cytochrome c oxidase assembly protein subunit 11